VRPRKEGQRTGKDLGLVSFWCCDGFLHHAGTLYPVDSPRPINYSDLRTNAPSDLEISQGANLTAQASWSNCVQESGRRWTQAWEPTFTPALLPGHGRHAAWLLTSEQKPEAPALLWKDLSPFSTLALF
jgi:hypothetical protein